MKLVSARWAPVVNVTWSINPELLEPHVPEGTSLYTEDNKAFVSLVAFDFLDAKLFGLLPAIGYRYIPGVNLRFYVRHKDKVGVVFLKELGARRMVAKGARYLYNENYEACPVTSSFSQQGDEVSYKVSFERGGKQHAIELQGAGPLYELERQSQEHLFQERDWGWGHNRRGGTHAFHVSRPPWQNWRVTDAKLDVDFGLAFDPKWRFLAKQQPLATMFAQGGPISFLLKGPIQVPKP